MNPTNTPGQTNATHSRGSRAAVFSGLVFVLALLATTGAVMAGFGTKWDWWHFRTGLFILRLSGYVGAAAVAATIIGCIWSGLSGSRIGFALALAGLLSSGTVTATLWQWKEKAQRLPRIHDITTDTDNPPNFVAVLPLRKDAPNPSEYGGPEIAMKQREGYPGLAPALLPLQPNEAFQKALATAVEMGWQIVEANQAQGRIEATDTTFWFGFNDDIVVRVTPDRDGTRVDIRSVSRVGVSDVGTNAGRIQKFIDRIRK